MLVFLFLCSLLLNFREYDELKFVSHSKNQTRTAKKQQQYRTPGGLESKLVK